MLNSFDNDMSRMFDAVEQEIRDDLEILEEYLDGMLLPALVADVGQSVDEPWQDDVVEPAATADEEFQVIAAEEEEPAGTSFTTSTMAEIYVSQGFVQRAIDIYEEMLTDNPLNDGIIKRIEELRALLAPSALSMATSEESIAAPIDEMAPLQAGPGEEKGVVETLERWLDNISSRRQ